MPPYEYLSRYLKLRIPKYRDKLICLSEEASFFAERNQREVAINYLIENYDDDDVIILTDVDEMLDVNDAKKRNVFINIIRSRTPIFKIRRKVFVYDFDNLSFRKRFIPIIKVHGIKKLRAISGTPQLKKSGIGQYVKHWLIWNGMKEIETEEDIFYEFSYCFEKSYILRKSRTYAHTGRGEVEFERALLCNHSNIEICLINNDFISNREHWYEKIEVSTKYLPSAVVNKFEELRTNSVANNYKEMRNKYYGI